MSGGISQLVAIGAQDAHLVGDPQVSFFKSAYMRHTNFSMVTDRQVIQGNVGNNNMSSVRFERKGDLLSHVYLTSRATATGIPDNTEDWTKIIDKVELLIGGQIIDTQDGYYSEMLATDASAQNFTKSASGVRGAPTFVLGGAVTGPASPFYPLRFSFCENWASALPLVALQYHDVEIRIYWSSPTAANTYDVMANYIYLDTEERESMAANPMNMLITQVQKAITSNSKIQELNFNHPVKYLVSNVVALTTDTGAVSANQVKLQINGTDVSDFKNSFINHVEASSYYVTSQTGAGPANFIYPFCLDVAKHQPSGTLNFSRLDSARLMTDANSMADGNIYGINYNVLAIKNGMGGLMYAN